MVDGGLYDTHDCSWAGPRCGHGYRPPPEEGLAMTARTVQPALTDLPLVKVRTLTAGDFLATVLAVSGPDRTWVRDTAGQTWLIRNCNITTEENDD
jgi:hypothetical protein